LRFPEVDLVAVRARREPLRVALRGVPHGHAAILRLVLRPPQDRAAIPVTRAIASLPISGHEPWLLIRHAITARQPGRDGALRCSRAKPARRYRRARSRDATGRRLVACSPLASATWPL